MLEIWDVLPDYGSYQADIEVNTGHSITSEEMQDVLMDFGNWSKDISIEDLEANAKYIADKTFQTNRPRGQ